MSKKMSKSKRIAVISALIVLIACMTVLIVFLFWKSYYNRVWQPLIDTSVSKGAKSIGDDSELLLEYYNDKYAYYVNPPKTFKYNLNLQISNRIIYNPECKEKQYDVSIMIWPQKDGSFLWGTFIDEIVSDGNYVSACTVYFDPDTFKITGEENAGEKEIYEKNLTTIKELTKEAKNFWEI